MFGVFYERDFKTAGWIPLVMLALTYEEAQGYSYELQKDTGVREVTIKPLAKGCILPLDKDYKEVL